MIFLQAYALEDDFSEMQRIGDRDGLGPWVAWALDGGGKEGWTCVGDGINHNGRTVQCATAMRCMQGVYDLTIALMIFLPVGMGSLGYIATMAWPLSSAAGTSRARWNQRGRTRPLAAYDYSMAGWLCVSGITRSSSSRGTIWKCPLDQVGLCHNRYHNAMAQGPR